MQTLLVACCLLFVAAVHAEEEECIWLDAEVGVNKAFESHDDFGITNYPSNYYRCWMIRAPEHHAVKAWATRYDVRRHDVLSIGCGVDADDGYVGRFSQDDVTPYEDTAYVPGVLAVEFETDRRRTATGFQVMYTAVARHDDSFENSCNDWSDEDSSDSDSWDSSDSSDWSDSDEGGAEDIVLGLASIILVGVIFTGCIFCCVRCYKYSVQARFGKQQCGGTRAQTYTVQFPNEEKQAPPGYAVA